MEKKRSIGVTILAVLLICYPIQIMLMNVLIVLFSSHTFTFRTGIAFIISLTMNHIKTGFVFDLGAMIIGIGLMLLKEWSRKCIIVFSVLNIILPLLYGASGTYPLWGYIVGYGLPILYVWFFTRPKVREQFKQYAL